MQFTSNDIIINNPYNASVSNFSHQVCCFSRTESRATEPTFRRSHLRLRTSPTESELASFSPSNKEEFTLINHHYFHHIPWITVVLCFDHRLWEIESYSFSPAAVWRCVRLCWPLDYRDYTGKQAGTNLTHHFSF